MPADEGRSDPADPRLFVGVKWATRSVRRLDTSAPLPHPPELLLPPVDRRRGEEAEKTSLCSSEGRSHGRKLLNNCDATKHSPKLIELDFHFCDFSVCFLAAAICLPGTGSINKLFRLRGGLFSSNCFSPPLSPSHSLRLSLCLSLLQIIVMEIIRGAKPQTKESP